MPKKRLYSLLKVAASLVLLAGVLAFTGPRDVLARLAGAQAGWLALALGAYLLGVLVRAVRWLVLLRGLGARGIGIPRLIALYFVSFFFNSFLPTGIGGDVVRIAEVARSAGAPVAASSVIADRAVGIVAAAVLALLALPFGVGTQSGLVVAVAAAIALGIPAGFAAFAWAARRGVGLSRLPGQARKLAEALTAYSPRDLAIAMIVSLAFAATNALNYACIGQAVGVQLPLGYYMLVSPIITLVLLLPISFNGLGTRDWAYVVLFGQAGVGSDLAVAMSVAYHALNYATAIAGGIVYAAMGTRETLEDAGQTGN